ncbi:MAG TPA: GDSL-type esterase/lipase family protein [Myxococcales bacterium]|nr:GDSL-type esterase/lipase family protein [Myxococcales bacterium]
MTNQRSIRFATLVSAAVLVAAAARAKDDEGKGKKWVASWITAPQGTFAGVSQPIDPANPSGPRMLTPRLVNLAFPFDPNSTTPPQANNQTLRMIVKPDVWGDTMRVRLSNYYGTGPVTFNHVTIGLQSYSGATVAGTNTTLTFNGQKSVTVPAGQRVTSDEVKLHWVNGDEGGDGDDGVSSAVDGRNLAISIYIAGRSGPMTSHGNALVESFLAGPGTGDHTMDTLDTAFPYETSSWFFVDGVEVKMPADTRVLVGAGSSSVDGSITTPGNNDRFLNWMSRRLHAAYGQHVSVVNAGIGGDVAAIPNTTMTPNADTCAPNPDPTKAQSRPLREVLAERFQRDVLDTAGITDVVFYAGTNDFGDNIPSCQSIAALTNMVGRLHSRGIKAIGGTLISNVFQRGTTTATYQAHDDINQFILKSGVFDSTADFYGATIDPNNVVGGFPVLRADYQIHSDPDGTPDFLHLGRNGAQAEANTLDLKFFAPSKRDR